MADRRQQRVMIIEPSSVVEQGLRAVLSSFSGYAVVGSGCDMAFCEERLAVLTPDIVIMNPSVVAPRVVLRSACPELQNTTLVAVVYSVFEPALLRQFDGVVNIFDSPSAIVAHLRDAVESGNDVARDMGYDLSERERDILVAVAQGKTNKEIAEQYNISIHTVISHRKNITRKTGVKTVAGLTVYAFLHNLIDRSVAE